MKLAIGRLPRSMGEFLAVARETEAAGFWGFGVGDSHYLYHELYPAITACLLNTRRITVGPCVTNAVSRNWSIHASSARTFEELAPGRFVLGIATGDGSVYSVGLRPQRWAELEADIRQIRARSPPDLKIQVTVSGPKGAAVAGRAGDAVVIAVGDDAQATNYLAKVARAARAEAGIKTPLEVWVMIPVNVVATEAEIAEARHAILVTAIGMARFSLQFTFDGKNIPPELQAPLRERLSRYTHQHHASRAEDNPNRRLFADQPKLVEYLTDRMVMVGTREQCARRVERLGREAALDGMWLSISPPDGVGIVRRAGEAFAPLMKAR
jgi:alkanesulfonate monooxygenase SsuD/methylene tetrahydromethanopterin reductase-like flavin-dependent oxidoreductase (luciferase family)